MLGGGERGVGWGGSQALWRMDSPNFAFGFDIFISLSSLSSSFFLSGLSFLPFLFFRKWCSEASLRVSWGRRGRGFLRHLKDGLVYFVFGLISILSFATGLLSSFLFSFLLEMIFISLSFVGTQRTRVFPRHLEDGLFYFAFILLLVLFFSFLKLEFIFGSSVHKKT